MQSRITKGELLPEGESPAEGGLKINQKWTDATVAEIKNELDKPVALWEANAFLVKALRKDSDKKYATKKYVTAAEGTITKKKGEAENAISDKQKAALGEIETAKSTAVKAVANKQAEVVNAATAALDEIGTQKDKNVKAVTEFMEAKQTLAESAIAAKQMAALGEIGTAKNTAVGAVADKQHEVEDDIKQKQEEAENAIDNKKNEATKELKLLEEKKTQISEEQARKLHEEQNELRKEIKRLEKQLDEVSESASQLSAEEIEELKNKFKKLKELLENLQAHLDQTKQDEMQTSKAKINELQEERAQLTNELQRIKNERVVESQKLQEERQAEEQKIIEEKIVEEIKQKEELEYANNNVVKSQDAASNATISIKSMETLSYAVNLAVSQLIRDRISNVTQMNSDEEKDLVAQVNKRKIVASGSQAIYVNKVQPTSWDIWGSMHASTISQGTKNNYGATSKTGLYGFVLGIDKIFGYNILGFSISYGQSRARYTVPQLSVSSLTKSYSPSHHINTEQKNSYYQASIIVLTIGSLYSC